MNKQLTLSLETIRQDLDVKSGVMTNTLILRTSFGNLVTIEGVKPEALKVLLVDAVQAGMMENAEPASPPVQERKQEDRSKFVSQGNYSFSFNPSDEELEEWKRANEDSDTSQQAVPQQAISSEVSKPIRKPRPKLNKPRVVGKDDMGNPIMSGPPIGEDIIESPMPLMMNTSADTDEDGVASI